MVVCGVGYERGERGGVKIKVTYQIDSFRVSTRAIVGLKNIDLYTVNKEQSDVHSH